jgi:hypothetical protein
MRTEVNEERNVTSKCDEDEQRGEERHEGRDPMKYNIKIRFISVPKRNIQ